MIRRELGRPSAARASAASIGTTSAGCGTRWTGLFERRPHQVRNEPARRPDFIDRERVIGPPRRKHRQFPVPNPDPPAIRKRPCDPLQGRARVEVQYGGIVDGGVRIVRREGDLERNLAHVRRMGRQWNSCPPKCLDAAARGLAEADWRGEHAVDRNSRHLWPRLDRRGWFRLRHRRGQGRNDRGRRRRLGWRGRLWRGRGDGSGRRRDRVALRLFRAVTAAGLALFRAGLAGAYLGPAAGLESALLRPILVGVAALLAAS